MKKSFCVLPMTKAAIACILMQSLPLTKAQAETAVPQGQLTAGSRVRLQPGCTVGSSDGSPSCPRVTGSFVALDGDSLLIELDGEAGQIIHWGPGKALEVSAGRKHYTLLGLGLGTLTGVVAGALLNSSSNSPDDVYDALTYVLAVPAGALIGALVGTLASSERWRPLVPASTSLSLLPMTRGVTAMVRVSF